MNAAELTFRALRDIAAGNEITFNYLTTESEMAVPFNCSCGSTNCFGLIQGRSFLTGAQAERLARTFGEDNVVTLFLPVLQKSVRTARKVQLKQRSSFSWQHRLAHERDRRAAVFQKLIMKGLPRLPAAA